ncbi:MAG: twin-arginine translocase TatA/TatE family subunit [Alphaproteobacteria bacterium]|nr:twin-arginine translocase TatA/TatE family subunit [Alphaproteobacteria bacterium]
MSIGFTEILVIFGVIVILFGGKRIPELAKALGRASYEFKKAKEDIKRESDELLDAAERHSVSEDKAENKPKAKTKAKAKTGKK